jgi:hypothetical protein
MPHDDAPDPEYVVELDAAPEAEEAPPIRVRPDDLAPDTLRAVVESFVLREGTDYGLQETPLETKVAQVMAQLQRGDAHILDPSGRTVTIVVTRAIRGLDL